MNIDTQNENERSARRRLDCFRSFAELLRHLLDIFRNELSLPALSTTTMFTSYGINIKHAVAMRRANPQVLFAMRDMPITQLFDYFVLSNRRRQYARWFKILKKMIVENRLDPVNTLESMCRLFENVTTCVSHDSLMGSRKVKTYISHVRKTSVPVLKKEPTTTSNRKTSPSSSAVIAKKKGTKRQEESKDGDVVVPVAGDVLDAILDRFGLREMILKYVNIANESSPSQVQQQGAGAGAGAGGGDHHADFKSMLKRWTSRITKTSAASDANRLAKVGAIVVKTGRAEDHPKTPSVWTLTIDDMALRPARRDIVIDAETLMLDVSEGSIMTMRRLQSNTCECRDYVLRLLDIMIRHCEKEVDEGAASSSPFKLSSKPAKESLVVSDGVAYDVKDKEKLRQMGIIPTEGGVRGGSGRETIHVQHHADPFMKYCFGCCVAIESCRCLAECGDCLC